MRGAILPLDPVERSVPAFILQVGHHSTPIDNQSNTVLSGDTAPKPRRTCNLPGNFLIIQVTQELGKWR